jgi:SAM-dependent methyltransferase/DNA-binding transcriptional MerR regulator
MSDANETVTAEFTVDELARWAQLPVRTIREYQTMRLLPPPRRRGRIGVYGQDHTQRLTMIARLQHRGYSLAAIKDLLEARDDGTDLASLLGVDGRPVALDETPLRLTKAQFRARLPGLNAAGLRQASAVGLVVPAGNEHVLVRSPALLALVANGVSAGIGVAGMLEFVGVLRDGLGVVADSVADQIVERLVAPPGEKDGAGEVAAVLRRGRLLLLQGAVSILADRLGAALLAHAERDPTAGDILRAAIDQVRVGAIADADEHRPSEPTMTIANHEQAEHWNSDEAAHWVIHQAAYDRMLAPFVDMVLDAAALGPGDRVLDVGCGCGATTRAAAKAAPSGTAVGVDLSAPMLARARADAEAAGLANARFEQTDAQIHPFEEATFDAVISRFGIMFFTDPVAAFANLRRATRPGGRLAFVCWQDLVANEWLVVPGAAIAQHVPLPDGGPSGAAGMMAFADPYRVRSVLTDAGWRDITVAPQQTSMLVGGGGTLDEAIEFLRTGSMGRSLLAGADPETAARAVAAVREALLSHVADDGVRLDAAVWCVSARS